MKVTISVMDRTRTLKKTTFNFDDEFDITSQQEDVVDFLIETLHELDGAYDVLGDN